MPVCVWVWPCIDGLWSFISSEVRGDIFFSFTSLASGVEVNRVRIDKLWVLGGVGGSRLLSLFLFVELR